MIRNTIEQLLQDNAKKIILDIRRKEDYEKDTIPGAVWMSAEEVLRKINYFPNNRRIYLVCYTGETSDEMAQILSSRGLNAYSIEGGFHSYLRYRLKYMMKRT